MDLLTQLEQYVPWNEQEAEDREELLRRLRSGEDLYTRENRSAHLTASAWVVSPDRRQVLMAYHNLYNSWAATPMGSGTCCPPPCGRCGRRAGCGTCAPSRIRSIPWKF